MPGSTRPVRCAALALAALALLTGCAGRSADARPVAGVDAWYGREPDPAVSRPQFVLQDTSGAPYDFAAQTSGRPTLVYFGYTNCPDECPTAMADIAAALRRTDADLRDDVRVVFVSTDPERDTGPVLRRWLEKFDPSFVGLVGTQAQVDAAQEAAGLRPASKGGPVPTLPGRPDEHEHAPGTAPHTHEAPLGYAVEHTNVIFAYDVDDQLPVMYPTGVTAGDIAADLPRLAQEDRT